MRARARPSRRRAPVRYASSGDLSIAYQVTGDGPIDLVLVSGFVSHLEKDWEEPRHARFLERLGSIARLIRFDKRGTGLSDRPPGVPDLETRMDDVRAVMDAVGQPARRAVRVLRGRADGDPLRRDLPERTRALVLYGAYAKRVDPDDDYPWAPTREARAAYIEALERDWGFESDMKRMCPSADEAMARWWGERCRAAASPGAIKALMEMNSRIDVRALLPAIRVPTLVVNRGTDFDVRVEEGRYIAERIAGARFVELPGADHFVAIDADQILDAVEPFLAECGAAPLPVHRDRALVTLLITEIVGSTKTAAERGDRAWLDLVERHHEMVRSELARFRGHELEASGDGIARHVRRPRARGPLRDGGRARAPRRSGSTPGPACIRARWRCRAIASAASPFRSRSASPPRPHRARCSCPRPSTTSSRAPGSNSPTAAGGRSPASPANGACWRSSTWPGSSLCRS